MYLINSFTQNIVWLEVTVCHTPFVEEGEGLSHLPHNLTGLFLREPLPLLDVCQEGPARHLVKHQVETMAMRRVGGVSGRG